MDNLSSGISFSGGLKNSREVGERDSIPGVSEDVVEKLVVMFDATLQVEDVQAVTRDLDVYDHNDLEDTYVEKNLNVDLDNSANGHLKKCLSKCPTFPLPHHLSSELENGDDNPPGSQLPDNASYYRSLSLPTPRKLVSALKGGREKEGIPPRKLSVSWAPDVYDPPPTSVSHYPKRKSQQQSKNNKKHGKGKQKGKNARNGGGSPKDRKHYRKIGGMSEQRVDSFTDSDRVLLRNFKASAEIVHFGATNDVENPESSCASSFLRKYCGAMHVAYAEAM